MASAKVTFTATAPNGETFTRTSGTMPYTHVLMVAAKKDGDDFAPRSWHKSAAAAFKAIDSYVTATYQAAKVVEAVPTAVKGKANLGDFPADKGWNQTAIDALIKAKSSKKVAKPLTEKAQAAIAKLADAIAAGPVVTDPEPVAVEVPEAEVVADPEPVAVEVPKKPKGGKVAQRQAIGALVHQAVMAILDGELPEGITVEEAQAQLETWLRYIPNGTRAAGSLAWQARHAS